MAFVVWAVPREGADDEVARWYDEVHGPDAIGNGSFLALHRYAAAGPGFRTAPILAVWEAGFASEAEAWAYIGPRAQELRAAGRVSDHYVVAWATMLVVVDASALDRPVATLTTVQNDWRHPGGDPRAWLDGLALPGADVFHSVHLCTTDPAGPGPGRHLALLESELDLATVVAACTDLGAAGSSPTPPYTTIFAAEGDQPPPAPGAELPRSGAWVMHWAPAAWQRGGAPVG
jgi:hypothetical protein